MPSKIDLTNSRFGRLVVISESPKRDSSGNIYWVCACDCGTIKTIASRLLRNKSVVSCGCYHKDLMSNPKDILNQRFGMLRVIAFDHTDKRQGAFWECHCDCGVTRVVRANSLITGATRSCGCLNLSDGIRSQDLTGLVFGQYKAIKRIGTKRQPRQNTHYFESMWQCECLKCGETVTKSAKSLKHAPSETCIGHLNSSSNAYRALKQSIRNKKVKRATPKWADMALIEQVYNSRKPGEHVDHIIPLNGKLVCGLHVHNNLRVISSSENLLKNNKWSDSYEELLNEIP